MKAKRKVARAKIKGTSQKPGHWISEEDFGALQQKLEEAQETLSAIRNGEVDAVVVGGSQGTKIYSLAGAEQPYRVYVESMQEGAVTVSADGLILYCNQRFAEMIGLPLKRIISSNIDKHLGAVTWEKLGAIFGGSETVAKEIAELLCAKKRTLPVTLTASKLPLEDQDVMCLVVTDLSAQQENEALRAARDLAEKASNAKDAFLAALSHELRTPLTPALLAASALEKDASLPPEVRHDLAMIRRNVELETRLIDDLLDLTRIANNKLEVHKESADLHEIVCRALDICQPEIEQKELKVELHLSAREAHVHVDAVRMQQALWNLIRNAVKFTPGKGTISIVTKNPGPNAILVEVNDTGIGFLPGAEAQLFDAFAQAGRSITRQFGGLGLGLAITRSIVEIHEGKIAARSEGLYKGATFSIELPIAPHGDVKRAAARPSAAASEPRSLRILVVEDHEDTRASLVRLLARFGHQAAGVGSAADALDLADKRSFDIVISDLGLPDQSGNELMLELQSRFGLKGIAVSGYGMEEDVARSQRSGFSQHMTKPIQFERLRQIIEQVQGQVNGPE